MARITWKGEDALHPDGNGPRHNDWMGLRFIKGEPMDLDNTPLKDNEKAMMIAKAKGNPYYEVSEADAHLPAASPASSGITERRGPGRPPKPRDPEAL